MTTGPSVIRRTSAATVRLNFGKDALGSPTDILKAKFTDKLLGSTCVRRAIQFTGREDAVIQVLMRGGVAYNSTKDLLRDVLLFIDGEECIGPCISTPTEVKNAHHSDASLPAVNSSEREFSKNGSSGTSSLPIALDRQSQATQGASTSAGLEPATRSLLIADDLQELRRLLTCKICLDELVTITFVPCGHLVSCASCAPALRECPICRVIVRGTVRTSI